MPWETIGSAPWTGPLASWLLTYLVHSTLLIGVAWAVASWLGDRATSVQEAAWRLALLGGLVTASLQSFAGLEPVTGRWQLAPAPFSAEIETTGTAFGSAPGTSLVETTVPVAGPTVALAPPAAPSNVPETSISASSIVVAVWLVGASVAVVQLLLASALFRRRIADRVDVTSPGLLRTLSALVRRASSPLSVRLTRSSKIPVPFARGVSHPEICLPPRVIRELAEDERETLIAHELAHLERRDPLWLLAGRWVEAVLFFQPLNRLVGRRLRDLAEYRSDAWAARTTGRPLALARCLTRVAAWQIGSTEPVPSPSMAGTRRRLGRRVRLLLDPPDTTEDTTMKTWIRPSAFAALVVVALAAPGIGWDLEPPTVPEAPEPPTAPVPVAAPSPAAAPAAAVSATPVTPPSPVVRPSTPWPSAAPLAPAVPTPVTAPSFGALPIPDAPAPVVAPRVRISGTDQISVAVRPQIAAPIALRGIEPVRLVGPDVVFLDALANGDVVIWDGCDDGDEAACEEVRYERMVRAEARAHRELERVAERMETEAERHVERIGRDYERQVRLLESHQEQSRQAAERAMESAARQYERMAEELERRREALTAEQERAREELHRRLEAEEVELERTRSTLEEQHRHALEEVRRQLEAERTELERSAAALEETLRQLERELDTDEDELRD